MLLRYCLKVIYYCFPQHCYRVMQNHEKDTMTTFFVPLWFILLLCGRVRLEVRSMVWGVLRFLC